MKLSFSATQNKMIAGQYGAFELGVIQPGKREAARILKYTEDSPEGALAALQNEVGRFTENTLFEIAAKKNSKDNTATADVWQFNNLDIVQPSMSPPFGGAGFRGLGAVPQGMGFQGFGSLFDPADLKEEAKRLAGQERDLNKRELAVTLQEHELKNKEERHKERVEADRQILQELEKKYKSTTGAAQKGFEMLLSELLATFGRDGHLGAFGSKLMGLPSGAALGADESDPEESSPERQVIEGIAADIDALNLDLATLQKLRGRIAKTIAGMREGGEQ